MPNCCGVCVYCERDMRRIKRGLYALVGFAAFLIVAAFLALILSVYDGAPQRSLPICQPDTSTPVVTATPSPVHCTTEVVTWRPPTAESQLAPPSRG